MFHKLLLEPIHVDMVPRQWHMLFCPAATNGGDLKPPDDMEHPFNITRISMHRSTAPSSSIVNFQMSWDLSRDHVISARPGVRRDQCWTFKAPRQCYPHICAMHEAALHFSTFLLNTDAICVPCSPVDRLHCRLLYTLPSLQHEGRSCDGAGDGQHL